MLSVHQGGQIDMSYNMSWPIPGEARLISCLPVFDVQLVLWGGRDVGWEALVHLLVRC